MGVIFISHSSRDNEAAIKVRNWLKDRGWGQVFLDVDPEQGLAPGHRWQRELKQAGERCSGVLVLISPSWIASRWCQTEFLVADQLGKRIFPLFITPTPFDDLPLELKAKFQIADISSPEKETEGFERLAIGLKRAGLDPRNFDWPPPGDPQRSIYRGLKSLDEQDAAIFFGRDALVTKGLDALRRMRDGTPERALVILGASGAGKSSFLKAGLIARLRRDEENFLVLPVIRPERAAVTGARGLAASFGCDPAKLSTPEDFRAALTALRDPVVARLKRMAERSHEHHTSKSPTIVVPVDQAEELFSAGNAEAGEALELLAAATRADGDVIVVATIRSDSFSRLQSDPRFAEVALMPFSLAAIPLGGFKEVIEGPAGLASPPLAIEPALTERLLQDLAADDALPLLAFTLERLASHHRGEGALKLEHYTEEMGGLQGAITGAVDAAFARARRDPSLPASHAELESLARAAFIPALVQLDDVDAGPRRRVERMSALPERTRALVRHLIDERLLVSDRRTIDGVETDTVEVAHEAILRQWPALKSWIAEERDGLRALDGVRMAAAEWHTLSARDGNLAQESWLAHRGQRLEEAEMLKARTEFSTALGTVELKYLSACRQREDAERQREREDLARTRRLQRTVGALIAVAAAIVLLAAAGVLQLVAGLAARSSETLAELAAREAGSGYYDRAARYARAGLVGANWPLIGFDGRTAELELKSAERSSKALAVLRGHEGYVEGASFSPDGTRVVTASGDNTARLWDAATGREIGILKGHTDSVWDAVFSPDGTRIATASTDKTARIWDAKSLRMLLSIRGHDSIVNRVAYSPDGTRLVTASDDKTARVWDAKTGRELATIKGHDGPVESAAFSPDGTRIVTASDDKTARIWDAKTGAMIGILRGHTDGVNRAVFAPDGKRIATSSDDKTVRIWDAASDRELVSLQGRDDAVGIDFSPDDARIAVGYADASISLWDTRSARELEILRGHANYIASVAFNKDGSRLVSASTDNTARIWNTKESRDPVVLRGHDNGLWAVAFDPSGKHVVTTSDDMTARIWDAATGTTVAVLRGHTNFVEGAAFSPDGRRIVTTSDDKTVRIWDSETGKSLAVLSGHGDVVNRAVFSSDGTEIASSSRDDTARIWDARSGRTIAILSGHGRTVWGVAFSPDGARIATTSDDGTARIWDAHTWRELRVLAGHGGTVWAAAFNPDGSKLVTSADDKTARIWDISSGKTIAILRGHDGPVMSTAYSADGKYIVTASRDRTARVWNAASGMPLAVLRGHTGPVENAVFGPDDNRVATASSDGTARIWNIAGDLSTPRATLIRRACATTLAGGLSDFSENELRAAPVLDPGLDADPCRPPSFWARLGEIFSAPFTRR